MLGARRSRRRRCIFFHFSIGNRVMNMAKLYFDWFLLWLLCECRPLVPFANREFSTEKSMKNIWNIITYYVMSEMRQESNTKKREIRLEFFLWPCMELLSAATVSKPFSILHQWRSLLNFRIDQKTNCQREKLEPKDETRNNGNQEDTQNALTNRLRRRRWRWRNHKDKSGTKITFFFHQHPSRNKKRKL